MSGVLIVGASRSGTSMTAGLFAQHGVWFGDCMGPAKINRKGFFENRALKRIYKGQERVQDFPVWWGVQRFNEGYTGGVWGAKCGAERWDQYWCDVPDIVAVVQCYRDKPSIEKSRNRAGFNQNRATVDKNWREMERMRDEATCFPVNTPRFIAGDFSEIIPVFDKIGLDFDPYIAQDWVDPSLWHGAS